MLWEATELIIGGISHVKEASEREDGREK